MKPDFTSQLLKIHKNSIENSYCYSIKVCPAQGTMKFSGDFRTETVEASLIFAAASIVLEQVDVPCYWC